MKILFFQWDSYMDRGVEHALKRLDLEFDTFFYKFSDWEEDDHFLEIFQQFLKEKVYSCVLSMNFSPLISNICEDRNIPYIAWVYDSPILIKDMSSLKNSCTKAYFFDRGQVEEFKKSGIDVEYMPLAVDTDLFQLPISEKQGVDYAADISLVGNLYQVEYEKFKASLNDYLQGYLEGIVGAQMKIYGGYLIPELVTEDLLNQIHADYARASKAVFQISQRELEFLLASEVTGRERYLALDGLSGSYKVDLYCIQKDMRLKKVRQKGYADYHTQMPIIFSQSKINLNISLKTIRTGIPLRVIDIMGCGGFVLSNYQEELAEYFVPEEECVLYESLEDLYAKVQFYLEHDTERQKIIQNSFKKIKRDFTIDERVGKMICGYV